MFDKDEKKLLQGGKISKKIKNVIWVVFGAITLLLIYIVTNYQNVPRASYRIDNLNHGDSEQAIATIQKGTAILLYTDYILINGHQYKIKTENGHLMVFKDGQWIPLSALKNTMTDGSFAYVGGKPFMYENGKLVPLHIGDIIRKNGKSYIVGKDGKLHEINTDGVVWKNGIPYVLGKDNKLHALHDGDVAMINGKRMLWHNGHFIPLGDAKTPQIIWKNGHAYVKGDDGKLHEMTEGKHVTVNGKDYVWHNGHLVLAKGLSRAKVPKPHNGDFKVAMGHKGKPLYWKYVNGKLVPVSKEDLKAGDLVYYKGQAYQVGKDGKLHPLKAGALIWRNGKLYTMDANGHLHAVKDGELVNVNGHPMMYKNGHLVPVSKAEGLYAIKHKKVMWMNGKPYLMGTDGKPHPILNGQIIFRGGQAYRYIDGHFVKLTPEALKELNKPPVSQPKAKDQKLTSTSTNNIVGHDNDLAAAIASGMNVNIAKEGTKSTDTTQNNGGYGGLAAKQQAATNNLISKINAHPDSYNVANGQSQKSAFMSGARNGGFPETDTSYQRIKSPYTISMGTMLDATLVTGIDSDLPGEIIAQINHNVFDSVTGNYLLIPQGSKVLGKYDSQVSYGQERVLMAWTTLILPNGNKIDLKGQEGVDLQGLAGLTGDVNNHWWRVFKNVLMMSVFGSGIQIAAGGASGGGDNVSSTQLVAASLGQQLGQAGLQVIKKSLDIQPTINIQAGDNFKILLARDFILPSPYNDYNKPALRFN